MTFVKNLLIAGVALGISAMGAWAQQRVQSTAPEPATAPSQAVTPPQPATAPSSGTGPAATVRYSFEMVDRNADGRITRAEAALVPELLKNFGNLDRNNDGRLDRTEFVGFSR